MPPPAHVGSTPTERLAHLLIGPLAARDSNGTHGALRRGARVLFVDDDPALLLLLRATFELIDIEISEARTGAEALAAIGASPPDVVVLDIGLPDVSGLTLTRSLKGDRSTSWIGVVLLTGAGIEAEEPARAAGADAFLRKPFSPLELLEVVERLAGGLYEGPFHAGGSSPADEQLLLYANDLRRLLEIERGRQQLLQRTYRQTVAALAGALETKDIATASHSQRVQRYAVELALALDPALLDHPSAEYGFLLHDVGKIGIPDRILQKPGPLSDAERSLMREHTVLGEQLLERGRPAARRRAPGRAGSPRAVGRHRLSRPPGRGGDPARGARSSRSPTPSTRSRATAPTGPRAAGTSPPPRSSASVAASSTPTSSTPFASGSPACARSAACSPSPRPPRRERAR